MEIMSIVALSILLVTICQGIGGATLGVYRLGDPWNARYDLSRYMLDEFGQLKYYCVKDAEADSYADRNYSYCFNIASATLDFPKSDGWNSTMDYCRELNQGYCPPENINSTTYSCETNDTKITDLGIVHIYSLYILCERMKIY